MTRSRSRILPRPLSKTAATTRTNTATSATYTGVIRERLAHPDRFQPTHRPSMPPCTISRARAAHSAARADKNRAGSITAHQEFVVKHAHTHGQSHAHWSVISSNGTGNSAPTPGASFRTVPAQHCRQALDWEPHSESEAMGPSNVRGAIAAPDDPGAIRAGSGDCAPACDIDTHAMLPARIKDSDRARIMGLAPS
jgi:hypothetical protein